MSWAKWKKWLKWTKWKKQDSQDAGEAGFVPSGISLQFTLSTYPDDVFEITDIVWGQTYELPLVAGGTKSFKLGPSAGVSGENGYTFWFDDGYYAYVANLDLGSECDFSGTFGHSNLADGGTWQGHYWPA